MTPIVAPVDQTVLQARIAQALSNIGPQPLGLTAGTALGKNAQQAAIADLMQNGPASWTGTALIGLLGVLLVVAGVWGIVGGSTVDVQLSPRKGS